MAPTLYSRIYSRLADLIPALRLINQTEAMYAPPKQKDDLSLFCVVTPLDAGKVRIEIVDDQDTADRCGSSPWMVFDVDHQSATAEMVAFQDAKSYYKKSDAAGRADVQRTPLNIYAVNWLTVFINLHFQFVRAPSAKPAFVSESPLPV